MISGLLAGGFFQWHEDGGKQAGPSSLAELRWGSVFGEAKAIGTSRAEFWREGGEAEKEVQKSA